MSQIGTMVNKSSAGVKKDLAKEKLTMDVLESYAKALHINLYEILGEIWKAEHQDEEMKGYTDIQQELGLTNEQSEIYDRPKKTSSIKDRLTVTLDISGPKKDAIMKILLEK